jgi:hypothetical protein
MDVEFTVYEGDQFAVLWGNSHAELWENSHAVLRENSHAELMGNSHAELWGNSHAELMGNSHAVLRGNSHAELWGNSHAVLRGNSHAELWENSHAVLRENSHAELWGNSHAELWENSHAVLWGNSHAQCRSPYACGILKSIAAKCIGRSVGKDKIPAFQYLKDCGVELKNQYTILYKSTKPDGTAHRDSITKYVIGEWTVAPDWDPGSKEECGKGLHLSPTIQQAIAFNDSGCYFACRVAIKDIADLPAFAQMPDKIRVRACKPIYLVDKDGNKMEAVK